MYTDSIIIIVTLALRLLIGLISSWCVGIIPALVLRYAIFKSPIPKNEVFWPLAPILTFLMFAYKLTIAGLTNTQPNPNPIPWIIIYYIGKWIMTRTPRLSKSYKGSHNPSDNEIQISDDSLSAVSGTDTSINRVTSFERTRLSAGKESGHSDENSRNVSIDSDCQSKSTICVFISYRSIDRKFAEQLATDLRRRDIHAWLDEWNMAPGKPLEKAMIQGIESCSVMLLVLSRASTKAIKTGSGGVPFEFGVSKNRAETDSTFKIIGVLKEYCLPPKDLADSIGRWINFIQKRKYKQRVDELAEWIKNPEADLGPSVTNAGKMPIKPGRILLSLILGVLKSWGVAFVTLGLVLAILIPLGLMRVLDGLKKSPVYRAVAVGNINELDNLLLAGEDPDEESGALDSTALHLAAGRNNLIAARKLLQASANPNAKDRYGWSPLHHTITSQECHPEMIELLCEWGANPNQMDNRQRTPLHRAAAFGCDEAVRALLQVGADPNVQNRHGVTPLEAGQHYETVMDVFNEYFEHYHTNLDSDSSRLVE